MSEIVPRRVSQSTIRNPQSAIKPRVSRARWAAIRLFAMDVDGVLTDGTVHISSDGTEAKTFSILDGFGLKRLASMSSQISRTAPRPADRSVI